MQIDDFLTDVLGLQDPELLRKVRQIAEIRYIRKGQLLFREGEKPGCVAILVHGIFRSFFFDMEGRDITDCIVCQSGLSLMPGSDILASAPASTEALADSEIFCLPAGELIALMKQYSSVMQLYNQNLQWSGEYHMEVKRVICSLPAVERYQWFLRKYPGLVDRIANRHIASFLNMTPVTLSRRRKQLREADDRKESSAGSITCSISR